MITRFRDNSYFPSLVEDFFGKDWLSLPFGNKTGVSVPAVNVRETNDGFHIEVAAPGLAKDDFKIDLENNVLTISSEREMSEQHKGDNLMRREFCYSSFTRSFTLPDVIDPEQIQARHENGILFIEIPKREEARRKGPRQIAID